LPDVLLKGCASHHHVIYIRRDSTSVTLSLDSAIVTSKGNMCRHKKKRDGNREGREGGDISGSREG